MVDKHDKHHKHEKHLRQKEQKKSKHEQQSFQQQHEQTLIDAMSLKTKDEFKAHVGKEDVRKHQYDIREDKKHKDK